MKVYTELLDVTKDGVQSYLEDRTHKKIALYTSWTDYRHNTYRHLLAESEPFTSDQNWQLRFHNHIWEYIASKGRVYLVATEIDI